METARVMVLGALAMCALGCGGGQAATRRPAQDDEPGSTVVDEPDDDQGDLSGDLGNEKDVRGMFERKQSTVARCYTKRLVQKPDLAKGAFEIKTTIVREKATGTEVRGVDWRDSEIEACVTRYVGEWTFADVRGPVTITYRYVFDKF